MRAYIIFLWSIAICMLNTVSSIAQGVNYSKVKIYATGTELRQLAEMGVTIDHGEHKKDVYFISDFSEQELNLIIKSGLQYEVLIDDVSTYYATQNERTENQSAYTGTLTCKPVSKVPSHFHLGKYAGFFGYTEILTILDSMQLLYPHLISKRTPIDSTTTSGGRPLYWLRISNKPNEDQPGKTQVFYNALHHAREPGSISQIIYFMWYLLDNYEGDEEIRGLVDNLELYFVPCVNPDGYVANQSSNPNGGGMKRTNGRGVDINRNYDVKWGYDNSGSSNTPGSDTYRGPSAGSEAETKMIKKFCIRHNFKLAMCCHTYGGLLIFPWGYRPNFFTDDNKTFLAYANFMTEGNNYKIGTPNQTVGYLTNGSSDDWFYGEQKLKNKIFEFTPEAGTSFYPAKNQILPFCREVLEINIKMAKLALKYVIAKDADPYFIKPSSGYFHYTFKSLVPDTMSDFSVRIIPLSPDITSAGNPKTYKNISIGKIMSDSISFVINPSTVPGTQLKYVLKVSNGQFTHSDTLEKIYGNPLILIAENGNSMNNWVSPSWNLSATIFHSPSSSITDSPNGSYANNANTTISSKTGIDLSNAKHAVLNFWTKWDIEENFDFVQLQASSDSGQTWIPLCGTYSTLGSKYQELNQPVYDGEMDWVQEEINLRDYVGMKLWFRFVLKSDERNAADGFYFDDFIVSQVAIQPNGIEEADKKHLFMISSCMPNPANDYLYINYKRHNMDHLPVTLVITNMVGQVVYRSEVNDYSAEGNIYINTSGLPNGIYMVQLQSRTAASETKRMSIVH